MFGRVLNKYDNYGPLKQTNLNIYITLSPGVRVIRQSVQCPFFAALVTETNITGQKHTADFVFKHVFLIVKENSLFSHLSVICK